MQRLHVVKFPAGLLPPLGEMSEANTTWPASTKARAMLSGQASKVAGIARSARWRTLICGRLTNPYDLTDEPAGETGQGAESC